MTGWFVIILMFAMLALGVFWVIYGLITMQMIAVYLGSALFILVGILATLIHQLIERER